MSLDTITVRQLPLDSAATLLTRARDACDPLLRNVIGSMPEPLAMMAGYHLGWWDVDRRAVDAASGKSIRAALTLAAATACGGDAGSAAAAAAAVELIHIFTLLHDDVMDADEFRRGRPTVWRVWGANNAILVGDALHAAAIRILSESMSEGVALGAITRLETSVLDLCAGQFEDCAFDGRVGVTVDDYFRMATSKTARLIGCACALGAMSAQADDASVAAMEQFGYQLGLAFQIVDDVLGIWGDSAMTGKPVGTDLARRKATLPVVVAFATRSDAAAELSALYKSDGALTPREIRRATELVEAAGGRRVARWHADQRVQAATMALLDTMESADLLALSHMVIGRTH